MATCWDTLPCFPCLNCQTYAFGTKLVFLLTLCNLGLFVGLILHLDANSSEIEVESALHKSKLLGTHNSTASDWDVQEVKSDMLAYSNLWFVLAPGLYAVMVSPDYCVEATGFTQLRSSNSKTRGLGILAMCVVVGVVSTMMHAFEDSSTYPGDPLDPAKQDSLENRIHCELTTDEAYSALIRGERDAAYVYACLPALWALKLDWLVARVSVYGIAFMASGFPEAVSMLWATKHPHWHAAAQTCAFAALGTCTLMDVTQAVQSTTESATDMAIKSLIWSAPALSIPWFLLVVLDDVANKVSRETLHDPRLNLISRTFLLVLNIGLGYYAWHYTDNKYGVGHMCWHFFSGTAALISLTLTVDWEDRIRIELEKRAKQTDKATENTLGAPDTFARPQREFYA